MTAARRRVGWPAAVVLAAAVGLVAVPLARLGSVAGEAGAGGVIAALRVPAVGTALWHTVEIAALVTALTVPASLIAALAVEGRRLPASGALRIGLLLPILVPQFVGAFGWQQAYGEQGLSDQLLGLRLPGLVGPAGVVLVLAISALPIAYLVVGAALATRAEPDLERAARAAGAGRVTAFVTITLPLLRGPLLGAAALVFAVAADSFAVPVVLGTPAGFRTVTTTIYADLALSSTPGPFREAVTLALLLVAIVAVLGLIGARAATAGRQRWSPPRGTGPVPRRRGAAAWLGAGVLWCYLALAVGIPLAVLVLTALTRAVGLAPLPANWSLANFRAALADPTPAALGHSLLLAAIAVAILLGLAAALVAVERMTGRRWGTLPVLTFVLPGSTVAVGVLIAYGRVLGDTLALILIAYLAKLWALAHQPLRAGADRLPPEATLAARASGATTGTAVRTVVVPALRAAAIGAAALVFLTALHEVTMSSLLYGPGSETLAVALLNLQQLGDVGAAAALAVLLTALVLTAAVPAVAAVRRRAKPR